MQTGRVRQFRYETEIRHRTTKVWILGSRCGLGKCNAEARSQEKRRAVSSDDGGRCLSCGTLQSTLRASIRKVRDACDAQDTLIKQVPPRSEKRKIHEKRKNLDE